MTDSPTLHTVVESNRVDHLVTQARLDLKEIQQDVARKFESLCLHSVDRAIRLAYRAGVADGFQQGALAAKEANHD